MRVGSVCARVSAQSGGRSEWPHYESHAKAIDELQTIFDLKKKKNPLMGITSSERSAPLIKAIVLAPGAKIAASNPQEIRTEFGEAEVLKIQTTSITYVVECDNLVKFLLPPKK